MEQSIGGNDITEALTELIEYNRNNDALGQSHQNIYIISAVGNEDCDYDFVKQINSSDDVGYYPGLDCEMLKKTNDQLVNYRAESGHEIYVLINNKYLDIANSEEANDLEVRARLVRDEVLQPQAKETFELSKLNDKAALLTITPVLFISIQLPEITVTVDGSSEIDPDELESQMEVQSIELARTIALGANYDEGALFWIDDALDTDLLEWGELDVYVENLYQVMKRYETEYNGISNQELLELFIDHPYLQKDSYLREYYKKYPSSLRLISQVENGNFLGTGSGRLGHVGGSWENWLDNPEKTIKAGPCLLYAARNVDEVFEKLSFEMRVEALLHYALNMEWFNDQYGNSEELVEKLIATTPDFERPDMLDALIEHKIDNKCLLYIIDEGYADFVNFDNRYETFADRLNDWIYQYRPLEEGYFDQDPKILEISAKSNDTYTDINAWECDISVDIKSTTTKFSETYSYYGTGISVEISYEKLLAGPYDYVFLVNGEDPPALMSVYRFHQLVRESELETARDAALFVLEAASFVIGVGEVVAIVKGAKALNYLRLGLATLELSASAQGMIIIAARDQLEDALGKEFVDNWELVVAVSSLGGMAVDGITRLPKVSAAIDDFVTKWPTVRNEVGDLADLSRKEDLISKTDELYEGLSGKAVDELVEGVRRYSIGEEFANGATKVERSITHNGVTITLVWTKNGTNIDFGKRTQLRTILGTAGEDEAHHIVVWTRGGADPVVQKAALDGFHLNMFENGVDLSKFKKSLGEGLHGNHPKYDDYLIHRLGEFAESKGFNYSAREANEFLQKELIPELSRHIDNAAKTDLNLNEYFKQVVNPAYGITN